MRERVHVRTSTTTSLTGAFARVTSTAIGSLSIATTGPKPRRAAAIGAHARAAADVEDRPAPCLRREELDAESGRRVCAGSERATGVDHDRVAAIRWLFPRWAEPEPARLDGAMECAPGVLPPVTDRLCSHVAEAGEERCSLRLVDVRGELDGTVRQGALLDPGGHELEQLDARDLDVLAPRAECDAPERHSRPSGYAACSHHVPSSRSR